MLEYASIRFTFVWVSATMLPTVIVSTVRTRKIPSQSARSGSSISANNRMRSANAPSFGPTDRKPVIGVGAPW